MIPQLSGRQDRTLDLYELSLSATRVECTKQTFTVWIPMWGNRLCEPRMFWSCSEPGCLRACDVTMSHVYIQEAGSVIKYKSSGQLWNQPKFYRRVDKFWCKIILRRGIKVLNKEFYGEAQNLFYKYLLLPSWYT